MKKIIYIALIIFSPLFGACNFLEVEVPGKNDIEKFYSDPNALKSALIGLYSETSSYYNSHFIKYPEVAGNMLNLTPGTRDMLNQFNFTSLPTMEQETEAVGNIWKRVLATLGNANLLLQYSPKIKEQFPNSKQDIEIIEAQALFIRALCHFDLNRVYAQPYNFTDNGSHCGVPILTTLPFPGEDVLRSTSAETYQRIIEDLTKSIEIFQGYEPASAYYIGSTASEALLARVYLYMDNWDEAAKYASSVISKKSLTPRNEYVNMFRNNEAGKEAIFRVSTYKKSSGIRSFYNFESPSARPTDSLYSLFENNEDIRLSLLIEEKSQTKACLKYEIFNTIADDEKHHDPFILRLSEMYLIRAEALCQQNKLNEAAEDIKTLISRATGDDISQIILNYTDKASLSRLIEEERVKELCFEGHNFFDIVRRKQDLIREHSTNSTVKTLGYPNDKFVLPIPIVEIDANQNIQQNPGYDNN